MNSKTTTETLHSPQECMSTDAGGMHEALVDARKFVPETLVVAEINKPKLS